MTEEVIKVGVQSLDWQALADLAEIWPVLRWFNRYLGSVQEGLINFSIETARDRAWDLARALNAAPREDWPTLIQRKDEKVSVFAALIRFLADRFAKRRAVYWGEDS